MMSGQPVGRRAFLGAIGVGLAGCTAPVGSQPTERPTETQVGPTPTATESPYARVYRETVGSVVLIQVTAPGFGSQGSGFVFDDGRVLTNQHVVAGASSIDVRFADGEWRSASVLGADLYSDLAVLAVDDRPRYAGPLSFVTAAPAIGTEVVAIGSPFGLEQSLSAGVVSGVHRSIPTSGGFSIPDAVQTDAALNPGNSGGPLVTLDGRAVGAIRSGGGENIGFAISAALIQRVAPALVERGHFRHPFVGVRLIDVTPTVAQANGLSAARGVLVVDVLSGGPADGVLRPSGDSRRVEGVSLPVGGDVIVGIDGQRIATAGALGRHLVLETRPGDTVEVTVVRAGEETTVDLTLGVRPPP